MPMSKTQSSQKALFDQLFSSINGSLLYKEFLEAVEQNKDLVNQVQKIYHIIDEIVLKRESQQFRACLEPGTTLFRARIINPADYKAEKGIGITADGNLVGYDDINSREPILGISGEGRNSIKGASYFYAASTPATACMEIKSQFGALISLATFEVEESLQIFDFTSDKSFTDDDAQYGRFFTDFMFQFAKPAQNEASYRATQIISDYLRKTGIDGIKYRSFLSQNGDNYTIFNCHPSKIRFCTSKVLQHKQANHSFWDFNEKTAIMSNEKENLLAYNETIAKKKLDDLSIKFKLLTKKSKDDPVE